MKTRIILILVLLTLVVVAPRAFAQDAVPSQEESTAERCSLTQNYLNTIQRPRDLKTRVDRLQAYRYIYQRMDAFVNRLERNNQPEAETLRASLVRFSRLIDSFKNNYEEYDAAREKVATMKNCRQEVNEFQTYLAAAREKRAVVHSDVTQMEAVLGQAIKPQLETLYVQLSPDAPGGDASE